MLKKRGHGSLCFSAPSPVRGNAGEWNAREPHPPFTISSGRSLGRAEVRGCGYVPGHRREEGNGTNNSLLYRIPNGDYIKRHAFWGGHSNGRRGMRTNLQSPKGDTKEER